MTEWSLVYDRYEPDEEGLREALCTLGNGYLALRGAAPEAHADDIHYPGTYLAGIYNRLTTRIAGRNIENEDLVNAPNPLMLTVRVGESGWLDPDAAEILDFRQQLDLRRGVLTRHLELRDAAGRETGLTQRRFVHMDRPHLAGLETTVVARNWSGPITIRSGLDGTVRNSGVERYRDLANHHLQVVSTGEHGPETIVLVAETVQSHVRIAEAARTRVHRGAVAVDAERTLTQTTGLIAHDLAFHLDEGEPATVEKLVAVFTSRDDAIAEPGLAARGHVGEAERFDELLETHAKAWSRLWDRFTVALEDDEGLERAQMILHLHILHLLQTVSPNSIDLDAGVPARGLHGEAYRGHVFWDELFIFPILNLRLPVLTRTLLHYRHRRLGTARRRAREDGLQGALFPWQSGSDGREESQRIHLNPRSGEWIPDHSRLQRHVNHAIAYNVWQYWQVTQDLEFMRFHGGELLIEIARMLASLTSYDPDEDRFHIRGVMGPDEYHEAYPDADRPGIDDNAYTNVMTVWVLLRTIELLNTLSPAHRRELEQTLELHREEIDRWEHISRRMSVPFHDQGIISQFEGYDDLEELDWEAYRQRYDNIQRMDRILQAEGKDPNRYKVSKQADVLMLFYLLPVDQVRRLLERLGYQLDDDDLQSTVRYYLQRTSHGSTLSRLVHSWVLSRMDHPRSWQLFCEALESDVGDIQGGTTREGIHLGAMAGTVDLVQRAYAGISTRGNVLWFDPALPGQLERLAFTLHYRGHRLAVSIDDDRLRITSSRTGMRPVRVGVIDAVHELRAGETIELDLTGAPTGRVAAPEVSTP